jgi:hypothetical protein
MLTPMPSEKYGCNFTHRNNVSTEESEERGGSGTQTRMEMRKRGMKNEEAKEIISR